MPSLEWNSKHWGGSYPWAQEGEEWSEAWGGSRAQWFGAIYPRISRWLPGNAILEIAPGFGRWTKFLQDYSLQEYYGVDLSEKCIAACVQRFSHNRKMRFFVNDGVSLEKVPTYSVDFVFSFDSLVHAETDVLEQYIPQILDKLTPNGIAFIHHSNAANLPDSAPATKHARAVSVSSNIVEDIIRRADGCPLVQEEINWGGEHLIDCFTTFCRNESVFSQPSVKVQNHTFMHEAEIIKMVHSAYHRL